jgi:hypothetical protein
MRWALPVLTLLLLSPAPAASPPAASPAAASPEARAIAYLATEVPRWSRDNHCFSCHNNGDGARALYTARRQHYPVPAAALADTTAWLLRPAAWDRNGGESPANDKRLARIQFAAALAEAAADPQSLIAAADSLLPYQEKDGSWPVDRDVALGSPATWGPVLATCMARRTLERADPVRFGESIKRAAAWLAARRPESIPDAAALLLCGARDTRAMIRSAQPSDGGWGPRPQAPPEVFDTALVLLAWRDRDAVMESGRRFLIRAQLPSGGWVETTRPSGGVSYAQHISTTGWATLALLATHAEH